MAFIDGHRGRFGGVEPICHELNRRGHAVARCTIERLARALGASGALRSERTVTTVSWLARLGGRGPGGGARSARVRR